MQIKIPYTINNKIRFAQIEDTHFSGFIGDYFSRFFENRVLSDFAKEKMPIGILIYLFLILSS